MSERLKHGESSPIENKPTQAHQEQQPSAEKNPDTRIEKLDLEKARERVHEIHRPKSGPSQKSHRRDTAKMHVPLPSLEPVADKLAKKLGTIRQNLSPSEKSFSKVIHSPVVSAVSEATAKTLARPYAILSGGIVASIGSALYLYYTRHLGYQYNFFVPILLFFAGLVAGIAVELLYKFVQPSQKRRG